MRLVSTTLRNAAVATSFALLSLACAVDDATSIPTAPAVQGLDRQTVTVGEPLVVFGQNFLSPDEGRTRVVFQGQFIPASTAGAAAPENARELAEYYEPTVVSGPFTGGIGTEIAYSETVSEDRQQGVSVGISKDWSRATGQEESESWEKGVETSSEVSTTNASGVDHSESKSSSETIGEDYSTSAENSAAVGTETGSSSSWNTAKEMSAEEYSDTMKELSGEVSAEVSASVTGTRSAEGLETGLARAPHRRGSAVGQSGPHRALPNPSPPPAKSSKYTRRPNWRAFVPPRLAGSGCRNQSKILSARPAHGSKRDCVFV